MLTPTHAAATYLLLSKSIKNNQYKKFLFLWALILSVIIDLDYKPISIHHQTFMHYPISWILLCSISYLVGSTKKDQFIKDFSTITLATALLHLFLDTFGVTIGVHWLYPFSHQEFSFSPLQKNIGDEIIPRLKLYFQQPIMLAEIAIVLTAIKQIHKRQPNTQNLSPKT